jgi:hypothetical protein
MWDVYLGSFPEGTNPMYKERSEHDCQSCKSFIRAVGNIVAVIDDQMVSIWDVGLRDEYQVVADAMAKAVKKRSIDNRFLSSERHAGVDKNHQLLESGDLLTWEHFYIKLPSSVIEFPDNIGTKLSKAKSARDVFKRSLEEISNEAIEIVLELIDQKSLYRGEEHTKTINGFRKQKKEYDALKGKVARDIFYWNTDGIPIRNTVIGTLLTDISDGVDLDKAVKSFETKVAPANYKRPTAIVSKRMIENAQKKVEELGFMEALPRRYAITEDVTVNNVLFADRQAKKQMGVFEELAAAAPSKPQKLDKVEEVPIETFVNDIVPKAESIEIMVENSHAGNFMSLLAPVNVNAPCMLKWKNNFSWSYVGEVADSVKERVKSAGGNVTGDLRCSLAWYNYDDLDLHMVEPDREHISYNNKRARRGGGQLDVDMNAGSGSTRNAVENVTYPSRSKMKEGKYKLFVNNFCKRESCDVGFEVEIEFDGMIHKFAYEKAVPNQKNVTVAEFMFTRSGGIEFLNSLPSDQQKQKIWGVHTQEFQKVSMLMFSPNYWDGEKIGNRHYFFMLEGCHQEGPARGFYNEFLTEELREHRKVFEVLGSKMKAPESEQQLSGLGFSTTKRNHVFCRVTGSFSRTVKVIF